MWFDCCIPQTKRSLSHQKLSCSTFCLAKESRIFYFFLLWHSRYHLPAFNDKVFFVSAQGLTPSLPRVDAVTSSLPRVDAVTPSMPCVDAVTPSLPRVDAVTPSLPLVDAVTPSLPCVDAVTPSLPRVDAVTPSLPYVDARCLPGRKQTVKFEILSLLLLFIISSVLKDLHWSAGCSTKIRAPQTGIHAQVQRVIFLFLTSTERSASEGGTEHKDQCSKNGNAYTSLKGEMWFGQVVQLGAALVTKGSILENTQK